MNSERLENEIQNLKLNQTENECDADTQSQLQSTFFTELVNDVSLHYQIIRFPKQIFVWIGYNSARLGQVYAAASTRPNNVVSVTNILGGNSDNTGSGIARRLVLKTGLNIIMACNIPKNSPMVEIEAEKILLQKLISLGYTKSKLGYTKSKLAVTSL